MDDIVARLTPTSSVASFLVLGGGGQDPEMYRQKYMYLYCASERSERAPQKHIFSGLKYICIHIQSVQFPFITYGIWRYKRHTDKYAS